MRNAVLLSVAAAASSMIPLRDHLSKSRRVAWRADAVIPLLKHRHSVGQAILSPARSRGRRQDRLPYWVIAKSLEGAAGRFPQRPLRPPPLLLCRSNTPAASPPCALRQ